MLYLGIFGLEFRKAIVIFEINALKFVWLQSLVQLKIIKFGTKNALFRYFWPKMRCLWILEKLLSYLKSTPKFIYLQNFTKKKQPKFRTKTAWFGSFGAGTWKQFCHIWNQYLQICLIEKFHWKAKMPKFGTKNALFGYFWAGVLENYIHIWNLHLRICLITKFWEETKMPKFWTKNAWFGYFWPRMPYLGISGQEFQKNYCQIWNQHPWNCLIAKYREIMEMPKFGTKSALFGYFLARIFRNCCRIWNQHLQICLYAKFYKKSKMPEFGTKMPYLGIFGLEFENNVLIFKISTLEFT